MISDNHTIRILMVTRETLSDRRYGLGRSLMPLVEELCRRGIKADYLCQADLGKRALLWQRRLQYILSFLPGRRGTYTDLSALLQVLLERFNMGRLAAKLAARQDYTHVHCHDPIIAAGLIFFLRFRPRCQALWGVTEHGFACYAQAIHEDGVYMGRYIMYTMRKWEKNILLAATWVISPTYSGMVRIAHDLKISSLPANWYHLVHARPILNHYNKTEARNLLGWNHDTVYVLAIGRIAPVKQFPMLVEACSRIKIRKDFQLVILGDGGHDNLQNLAQQLGLARNIIFAITENVGLYLCATDLYVSASASESFGMANLEALTAGTAAICTAVGGVPEVVDDGALLVEPNPNALTEAIECMLNDQQLYEAVVQRGLKRAKTWPDVVEVTDQYEKIYRKAIH